MFRVQVERRQGRAGVTLFGDAGGVVAAWVQADEQGDSVELSRSHDGQVALVVVDEVISALRLADGHVLASGRAGRGIEASFPLDGRWTLEIAGELIVDGGHTGHQGGGYFSAWLDSEPRPEPAEMEAELARSCAADAVAVRARRLTVAGTA